MPAAGNLKKKAATAAKAARAQAPKAKELELRRRLSLHDAAAHQPILHHVRHQPVTRKTQPQTQTQTQNLDGDADAGPGMVARLKAFLSLRGFNTSGITSAQALSTPARTHRQGRILAASSAADRQRSVQGPAQVPKLKTVPREGRKLKKVSKRAEEAALMAKLASELQTPELSPPNPAEQLRRHRMLTWLLPGPPRVALASVNKLRQDLGLLNKGDPLEDAVYVAIDTEGSSIVREIGVSTLDTRDIRDITPDHRAANWISKVKHEHIVVSRGLRSWFSPRQRALFCSSHIDTPANARKVVLALLRNARQASPEHAPRKVYLVGQSIKGDLRVLYRDPSLRLDLSARSGADFTFDNVYDTLQLAGAAKHNGARLGSMRLGNLARTLGVDSRFWKGHAVLGWHNASNDAAYTMMVMLLIAVRWDNLPQEPPLREATPRPLVPRRIVSSEWRRGVERVLRPGRRNRLLARQERNALKKKGGWRNLAERTAPAEEYKRDDEAYQRAGPLGKLQMKLARALWGKPY